MIICPIYLKFIKVYVDIKDEMLPVIPVTFYPPVTDIANDSEGCKS